MSLMVSWMKGGLFGAAVLGSVVVSLPAQAQPARPVPLRSDTNQVYFGARITVSDIDKSLAFYQLIGLKVIGRSGSDPNKGQYMLSPSGLPVDDKVVLQYDKTRTTPIPQGALNELVFAVSDIDKRVEMLKAAGYTIDRQSVQTFPFSSVPPYPSSVKKIHAAFLKDPNGVGIELIQWDVDQAR